MSLCASVNAHQQTTWQRQQVVLSFCRAACTKKVHLRPKKVLTNMTMKNQAFEVVFPIENGDFPLSC